MNKSKEEKMRVYANEMRKYAKKIQRNCKKFRANCNGCIFGNPKNGSCDIDNIYLVLPDEWKLKNE